MHKYIYLFLCIFATSVPSLDSLELKRVILSTNNDPLYIEFWPVVAPLWEAMGLRPTLALVADENCTVDTSLGDVIRFPPLKDVPESLQAQVIRLFLPALFPDDGCLIADIDMLPISRSYFFNGAALCPQDAFLVYRRDRANGYWGKRYPMCYLAAKGQCFGSVFEIYSWEDIATRLREWAALGLGWNTDELMLYVSLIAWEKKGGGIVRLNHGAEGRLDRLDWHDFSDVNLTGYIDCHCPRPYSAYKKSIDHVTEAILKNIYL